MTFVTGAVNDRHRQLAAERAAEYPILKGSHRGVEANEIGALGEVIAESWLARNDVQFQSVRTTRTDLVLSGQKTLEIKTKDRTVAPKLEYEASIPLYNHDHQQPDYYLFVSLERKRGQSSNLANFHTAHIVGASSVRRMHQHGKVWEAGETDPDNGTTFWTDCLNIKIGKLVEPEIALLHWRA
jgi:hypothetical protein